jgi:hypothetical protein
MDSITIFFAISFFINPALYDTTEAFSKMIIAHSSFKGRL